MLRRTVMRAFGSGDDSDLPSGERPRRGRPAIRWSLAVDRLFEDVLGILRRHAVGSGGAPEDASPSGTSTSGGPLSGPPPASGSPRPGVLPSGLVSLDGPRSQLEGYEFVLEGPRGRLRCVNTLRGFLRVRRELRGSGRRTSRGAASRIPALRSRSTDATGTGEDPWTVELITVQAQGGGYRPVRKRLGMRGRGDGGAGRSPFRYTSVPELAADFRRFVLGDALLGESPREAPAQTPRELPLGEVPLAESVPSGGSGAPSSDYPKT